MMKIEEYNMEYNEKNLPLAKWLIDKTNTKDYRIGNLLGMKHPKVEGDLLKIVGGRDELVRQAKVLERIPALGGEEYLHFDWRDREDQLSVPVPGETETESSD